MTRNPPSARNTTAQQGFTLIEVLVAMIVLAIGLLGLAGLQASSLRNDQAAFMRTQATILAYDIADRMRANQGAVIAGDYSYDPANDPAPVATPNCNAPAGCSVSQMAANDLTEWLNALNTYLPQSTGTVCVDSTPVASGCGAAPAIACDGVGSQFAITVTWTEQSGAICNFTTSFQP
jgi:type IV pilus assembly protein PilV